MKSSSIINHKFNRFSVYAVHKGTLIGHLLTFIELKNDVYGFLSLHNLKTYHIPLKDVNEGIESNLLRCTDIVLDDDIRTLCQKQYMFNIENK